MTTTRARGVLFVHSSPRALCPHLEWAIGSALGYPVNCRWEDQPVLPGTLRAEMEWMGPVGSGAAIASALRGWEHLRYEVTEDPSPGHDGARWMHTPDLGVFCATIDAAGNIVVQEDRIRYALDVAHGNAHEIARELRVALGSAWDDELEAFRHAGDESSVVWLHRVG